MTPERWQQVKQIFQSAIDCPPDERAAFLAQACQDDPMLRGEVESLISSHDQASGSFQTAAVNMAAQMFAEQEADSFTGRSIGPYGVVGLIGRGGMGEVYLAEDSRLARKVVLKL